MHQFINSFGADQCYLMLCFIFTKTNTKQTTMCYAIFVKLSGTLSIISQLSQEVAEVLHVQSACFAIACQGHLYGDMLISIFSGSIVQPKNSWTPLCQSDFYALSFH